MQEEMISQIVEKEEAQERFRSERHVCDRALQENIELDNSNIELYRENERLREMFKDSYDKHMRVWDLLKTTNHKVHWAGWQKIKRDDEKKRKRKNAVVRDGGRETKKRARKAGRCASHARLRVATRNQKHSYCNKAQQNSTRGRDARNAQRPRSIHADNVLRAGAL